MSASFDWALQYYRDGDAWLHSPAWDGLAIEWSPAATSVLQDLLPWERIAKQLARGDLHPAVRQHITRPGVARLLQLGEILAGRQDLLDRLRRRLRRHDEYLDAVAELVVGERLRGAGGSVQFEPAGRRDAGPDWQAEWSDCRAFVEVKRPRMSELAVACSDLDLDFLLALQAELTAPSGTDIALRFEVAPALVQQCLRPSGRDTDRVQAAAKLAAAALQPSLSAAQVSHLETEWAAFEFSVRPGSGRVFCEGEGVIPAQDRESRKVRDLLVKACRQLNGCDGVRVLAIYLDGDPTVPNHGAEISGYLEEEAFERIDLIWLADWEARAGGDLVIARPSPSLDVARVAARLRALPSPPGAG